MPIRADSSNTGKFSQREDVILSAPETAKTRDHLTILMAQWLEFLDTLLLYEFVDGVQNSHRPLGIRSSQSQGRGIDGHFDIRRHSRSLDVLHILGNGDGGKNPDDGDDDHQFDEGETAVPLGSYELAGHAVTFPRGFWVWCRALPERRSPKGCELHQLNVMLPLGPMTALQVPEAVPNDEQVLIP